MNDARLKLRFDGKVARLVFRRAEKLNALDAAMVDALVPLCRQIERSDARVVILTGKGKSFWAGGDIAAWSVLSPQAFRMQWLRAGLQAFDTLARLRQPWIAVLNGHCLGRGRVLAACADLRIAKAHVKIRLPEPGLGIITGWSGAQRLSGRFGAPTARRMALMAGVFNPDQAQVLGIGDQVVPTAEGLGAAQIVADRVLSRAFGNRSDKNADQQRQRRKAGARWRHPRWRLCRRSSGLAKGLAAFRAQRKPQF